MESTGIRGPPCHVNAIGLFAGNPVKSNSQFSVGARTLHAQARERDSHFPVPNLLLRVDTTLDHESGLPLDTLLRCRIVAIDFEVHVLSLRRHLKLLIER